MSLVTLPSYELAFFSPAGKPTGLARSSNSDFSPTACSLLAGSGIVCPSPGGIIAPSHTPLFESLFGVAIIPRVPICGVGTTIPLAVCESSKLFILSPPAVGGL